MGFNSGFKGLNWSCISDLYSGGSQFESRPTHQIPYFLLTWFILILGTRWRRVVSLTPRPLYRWGKAACSHWIWSWVGPTVFWMFGEGTSLGRSSKVFGIRPPTLRFTSFTVQQRCTFSKHSDHCWAHPASYSMTTVSQHCATVGPTASVFISATQNILYVRLSKWYCTSDKY